MLVRGLLEEISTQADTMYSKCQHEFKKPQKHSVLGVVCLRKIMQIHTKFLFLDKYFVGRNVVNWNQPEIYFTCCSLENSLVD